MAPLVLLRVSFVSLAFCVLQLAFPRQLSEDSAKTSKVAKLRGSSPSTRPRQLSDLGDAISDLQAAVPQPAVSLDVATDTTLHSDFHDESSKAFPQATVAASTLSSQVSVSTILSPTVSTTHTTLTELNSIFAGEVANSSMVPIESLSEVAVPIESNSSELGLQNGTVSIPPTGSANDIVAAEIATNASNDDGSKNFTGKFGATGSLVANAPAKSRQSHNDSNTSEAMHGSFKFVASSVSTAADLPSALVSNTSVWLGAAGDAVAASNRSRLVEAGNASAWSEEMEAAEDAFAESNRSRLVEAGNASAWLEAVEDVVAPSNSSRLVEAGSTDMNASAFGNATNATANNSGLTDGFSMGGIDDIDFTDETDGMHTDLATVFRRLPVYLGDRVHIQNLKRGPEGRGFLDVTDGKKRCEGNAACVSVAASSDRNLSSGTWRVLLAGSVGPNGSSSNVSSDNTTTSANTSSSDLGGMLESGTEVHLQNLFRGPQGRTFLDIRNNGCEGNMFCVSGAVLPDRDAGSGSWELIRAAGPGPIYYGDEVYIRSKYNGTHDDTFLETRKFGCEGNRHCVSATSKPNKKLRSATWIFAPVFVKEMSL